MRVLGLLFTLLFTLALGPTAHAATITVNTTADEVNTNTRCSLREAVQAANTNKKVGACAAGSSSGTDVISIPAGTYRLTRTGINENANQTGDLDVTGKVRLVGVGPATIIDGNETDRVFDVKSGAIVTMQRLSIQTGRLPSSYVNGGGIYNGGTLTLDAITVRESYAYGDGGGVYNAKGRTLTVSRSAIRSNFAEVSGGGIANYGTATVTASVVSLNLSAHGGGGMLSYGKLTVQGSTVTSNRAHDGSGGGIAVGDTGSATIISSTFRANMADGGSPTYAGGVDSNGGAIMLQSSTVTENRGDTGGITGNITITKTKVTGNTAYEDVGGPDCYGPIKAIGRNTIGDTTNCQIQQQ
jgi:CSLREA domain-containing protein